MTHVGDDLKLKNKNLISELLADPASCLKETEGKVTLKETHSYWTQVQCQMGVLGTGTCEFYICTLKDKFCDTISFDKNYWALICSRASFFMREGLFLKCFGMMLRTRLLLKKLLRSVQHCKTAKTENRQKPHNFKTTKLHTKTANTDFWQHNLN